MKKIIIGIMLLASTSWAQPTKLECVGDSPHDWFAAILDDTSYVPGSKFFNITDADLVAGFATALDMSCVGNRIDDDISCVGHWFSQTSFIVEVQIKAKDEKIKATVWNLRRGSLLEGGPEHTTAEGLELDCSIK